MNTTMDSRATREAIEGTWPVLPKERIWGAWGLTAVAISAGVAAWSYMIGGYVAYYLDAVMGTYAMIAGSLVGMFFVVLATIPCSIRYGVDTITASIPQFGVRGSYFSIFLQYASILGWNCLLLILLGRATGRIALAAGWVGESGVGTVSALGSLAAITVSWLLLRKGAESIRNYSYFISIIVTSLALWILYKLITGFGAEAILSGKPLASSGDRLWDYTAGLEILVASVLSWWPYMGGIVRMVPSARQAAWPAMLCMGLPTGVISLIGLYSALVTGDSDPTAWLIQFGGVHLGIGALVFLAMANIGTAVVGAYVASIGLKQIPVFQKGVSWNWITFIVLLPVAVIAVLIPNFFFDNTGSFFAFLGVFFAPVCGIQIVDYFLLRKQRVNSLGLYQTAGDSPYYFLGGINPAGVLGVLAGFFSYVYLLNPVSYVSHAPFKYTSASIPALVISALVYYGATKILCRNMGDYNN
ncbi:cytosine permease [Desulforhopalus singaporensis]|uniref:Nucleobase:cation symporter-1, NCS1 family n=1 Tax=Desulforhopalus singaporensis TaxID=91360 RepID=A0A1H0KEU6_9BACT|nr:cytosine permease [Desulforhopalus singaporensis]SDO54474.1 nucleobase:cation symporter-1, NCS1 family [Desulforhopalus singaporensis]